MRTVKRLASPDPEGVESSLIGVVAPDGLDGAVADKDQLASSDVERAFAAGRGGPLDGHDVGVANGDVEQLGSGVPPDSGPSFARVIVPWVTRQQGRG